MQQKLRQSVALVEILTQIRQIYDIQGIWAARSNCVLKTTQRKKNWYVWNNYGTCMEWRIDPGNRLPFNNTNFFHFFSNVARMRWKENLCSLFSPEVLSWQSSNRWQEIAFNRLQNCLLYVTQFILRFYLWFLLSSNEKLFCETASRNGCLLSLARLSNNGSFNN